VLVLSVFLFLITSYQGAASALVFSQEMKMDDFQFYPTPASLAVRAWAKFKDRDFTKVLDPSAGDGALLVTAPGGRGMYGRCMAVDCVEIDMSKHDALREAGGTVVGIDFMKFTAGASYSAVIMNPPFSEGAQHVLHAWDIVEDAEIVAIVNAETIRNPFSHERQRLVKLIEEHGEVEFIADAFNGRDAVRKTDVEVALIWLQKESQLGNEIIGTILDGLKRDPSATDLGYEELNAVALSHSFVENSVTAFNAAVVAAKQASIAEARAAYYASWLGNTFEALHGDIGSDVGSQRLKSHKATVQKEFNRKYAELKNRAWTRILESTEVRDRLSSAGRRRLEQEFELIKSLEFTVSNIYGFLLGIIQNQGQIQTEMACAVFDLISKYHTDNTSFYMGWKSNNKHRTLGRSIKKTRFIIPGHHEESWRNHPDRDTSQLLADFDKVFAMLEGKQAPEISLRMAFEQNYQALKRGARIESSYFDIRWYPGIGTIHFFPKSKEIVDKLNRVVGRVRNWLPPEAGAANDAFWTQFDKADKFDKQFWKEVSQARKEAGWNSYRDPIWTAEHGSETEKEKSNAILSRAIEATLKANGIDPDLALAAPESNVRQLPPPVQSPRVNEMKEASQLPLLAA
jgi:predicted RNA methylase